MLTINTLGAEVAAIGRLLGLLTGPDDNLLFNQQWFSDPLTVLEQTPERLNNLAALLGAILGPGVQNPPPVFNDAQWFPIPNPTSGADTIFHIVTSGPNDTSGQLGLGLLYPVQLGQLTIEAFCYVPLFAYSATGTTFIAASETSPMQIGLFVTSADKFQVDGVSFTAVQIETSIFLTDKVPTFTLTFANLQGAGSQPATYNSLAALLDPTVEAWLGEVIVQGSGFLYTFVGPGLVTQGDIYSNEFATNTVGDLLTAANFLTKDQDGVYHLDLQNLRGQSAADIALNFVFALLDALAKLDFPLVSLPGGGIYVTEDADANGSTHYGLRLVLTVPLTSGTGSDGKPATEVDFCLGAWLTDESDGNNWLGRALGKAPVPKPGLSVLLLKRSADHTLAFAPTFLLTSVGLNIKGGTGLPLINVDGVTLTGTDLRFYLNPGDNLGNPAAWQYGFAARLDDIGIPLGSGFTGAVTASGGNPVAKNLVTSGDNAPGQTGGDAATGKTDAVNPTFSLAAAYVSGAAENWFIEFLPPGGASGDIVWFPINRKFGPLACEKIGLGWNQANLLLDIVLDAGVALSGLAVELTELSVGIPLSDPTTLARYELGLKGLDIAYSGGGVEITGGLLQSGVGDTVEYDGEAMIKASTFGIGAIGSYASLPGGGTSLFIFAILDAPLGGPPAFFVTGLALGFGFNRKLIPPAFDQVAAFPLVKGMQDPAALGVTPGQPPNLTTVLTALQGSVPPTRGEYWLAAGVMFTSFELIKSTVLLAVEFGNEFEILILGTSVVKLPQTGDVIMAYAELDIEVLIEPAAGLVEATAILSPNSFVLDQACHLTGGFAFYLWFGPNEHAGDFVLTIGGYHPAFKKPAWYPDIPRLGFNWQVSDTVEIAGGVYFALTPSCIMAGGSLQALFHAGDIRAWFDAHVDMLIAWKPFFYDISIGVSIGVSVKVDLPFIKGTIKVEVGADLEVWGPPTGGKAHVHLWIISFTISFGPDPSAVQTLTDWDGFRAMLPSDSSSGGGGQDLRSRAHSQFSSLALTSIGEDSGGTAKDSVVCKISYNSGVSSTVKEGEDTVWVVNPADFAFNVATTVPVTAASLNHSQIDLGLPGTYFVAARPMGVSEIQTPLEITITGDLDADWEYTILKGDVPEAMWGKPLPPGSTPPAAATLLKDRVTGLTSIQPRAHTPEGPPIIDLAKAFTDVPVTEKPERLPLAQKPEPAGAVPTADPHSFQKLAQIASGEVSDQRSALFAALGMLGIFAGTNGSLTTMAADPYNAYRDAPLTGSPLPA